MADANPNLRTLFCEAIEKRSPTEQREYLDSACGGDTALRAELDALLESHRAAHKFLGGSGRDEPLETELTLGEFAGGQIGPYKLLQQLGEGGMGTVFMAEQTQPVRRKVAIKVIKPGMDSRQVIARFEAERQALAMMDHLNIARVLDAGATEQGRPYFVMELVHGLPITKYCDDNQLTPRARLELFVQVCQAIQHAHQKGVIHRDIKPSNVMVTLYDGRPVPKVIDFGVAKATEQRLTERTLFTQYGTMVGTPEYMSPEQAEMSALGVDTRSDIFSLGVLLYELLAGSTPLDHQRIKVAAYAEVLRMIREEEPPKPSTRLSEEGQALASISAQRQMEPSRLAKLLRGELDWIVMKALEKDRNRRYESVNSLADDVQRYLADEPVQACPPSAWYKCRKFGRRHKAAFATALAVACALLLALGSLVNSVRVLGDSNTQITAEQNQTKRALNREKRSNAALARSLLREEQTSYFRNLALSERELAAGNVGRAEELLDDCPASMRGWEWFHLKRRPYGPRSFREHGLGFWKSEANAEGDATSKPDAWPSLVSGIWGVAFSPDDRVVASASVLLFLGKVRVWDRGTGKTVCQLLGHLGPIEGLAFSPDGRYLATASWDKTIGVWDTSTWRTVHSLHGHDEYVRCVSFSRDGRFLASGGGDRAVMIWDAKSFKKVRSLHGHTGGIYSVAFGLGNRLASASSDGTVRVWDAAKGKEELTLREHAGPVVAVAVSRDGRQIASGGIDGTARIWDAKTGRLVQTFHIDNVPVISVALSKDGKRLAAGSLEKSVGLWDMETGQEALTLRGHDDAVMAVAFSSDGRQLASASMDGTVKLWDSQLTDADAESLTLSGHQGTVYSVAFQAVSPGSGRRSVLASASRDQTVKIWDAKTGRELRTLRGHAGPISRVAYSSDGRRLVSADLVGVAKVWEADSSHEIRAFNAFAGIVTLSSDGRRLAFATEGATVHVRDVETGNAVTDPFETHPAPIAAIAFSPDGQRLVTGSWDHTAKVWDATTGRSLSTLSGHAHTLAWVAYSADGRRLATASWDKTAKIWDSTTGKELHTLRGHQHRVLCVAFSPDGKYLASASQDNTVRIWDAETGARVDVLHGHTGYVGSVAFSADGRRLASAGGFRKKGEVKIWDTTRWTERTKRQ